MKKVFVTQALLPERKRFHQYVDRIFDSGWLTNRSQFVRELETKLEQYLGVKNVILVSNGTLALQLAYRALDLHGKVITTPFSFIATASSAKWEGLDVVFSDIDQDTWNINTEEIRRNIDEKTSAIVPVHVFGNPCDVESIAQIAEQHGLRVVYDAAHAFGVKHKGESVLNHGDISILSFHATKLFHTIEGGALIINDDALCENIRKMINFGITGPESIECLGINAKMNEFQAAMGLCLLDDMDEVISHRGEISTCYDSLLSDLVQKQLWNPEANNNYGYYPILFESESVTKRVQTTLNEQNIFPRRYFYPSLDSLPFLAEKKVCPVSEDIASRILCLPLYPDLSNEECAAICDIVRKVLMKA